MDPERADGRTTISATQIQPSVRWGNVPFGATSWITPSQKAAIAAKACSGIWERHRVAAPG